MREVRRGGGVGDQDPPYFSRGMGGRGEERKGEK